MGISSGTTQSSVALVSTAPLMAAETGPHAAVHARQGMDVPDDLVLCLCLFVFRF